MLRELHSEEACDRLTFRCLAKLHATRHIRATRNEPVFRVVWLRAIGRRFRMKPQAFKTKVGPLRNGPFASGLYAGRGCMDEPLDVSWSRFREGTSHGTISTGHAARRSTRSPTDPSRNRRQPRRRLDPRTTKSAFLELACNTIVLAGSPCCSTIRTRTPWRSARCRNLVSSSRRSLCCHENR